MQTRIVKSRIESVAMLAAAVLATLSGGRAMASLTVAPLGSGLTTANTWPVSSFTGSSPIIDSGDGAATNGRPSSSPVQIQVGGTPGDNTAFVVGQTFTPTSNFNLAAITLALAGNSGGNAVTLQLFQLTGVTGASASYTLSTQAGPELLGGGAGLTFNIPSSASGENFYEFDLENTTTADQISLVAGNEYAIELWNPNNAGFFMDRSGGSQSYLGGQIYNTPTAVVGNVTMSATSSVARSDGGLQRDALFAIYAAPVPEPTSLGLLAVGAAGLLGRRRRAVGA